VDNLAAAFLGMSREERSLLAAIESGMKGHEWVPSSIISELSGLPTRKVDFLLGRLFKKKLVEKESLHYLGYRIDFDAYDLLALSDLVAKGALNAIGERIGVGKESVVYQAFGDMPLAIKFHRQGRTSFKHVRRVRHNFPNKSKVPWLYTASLAARHEHQIMEKLWPEVSIPRPVAVSRHVLAMEFVRGPPLNRIALSDPVDELDLILAEVAKALCRGVIHADLSEFNILVAKSGPKIIDWPQAVEVTHPHARELLERDLSNVLRFFERKYGIKVPLEEALQRIEGAERI
jgi:RIO kinase 2